MSDPVTTAALVGLAGVLALDATAALQIMVSQPLVAGSIAGAVCGQPLAGMAIGGILQLVWLGALPVGAAGFPDAPVGTVAGVGAAWLLSSAGQAPGWCIGLGVGWAIVVGAVGRSVVAAVRRANVRLYESAARGAGSGDPSAVTRAVVLGLVLRLAAGVAVAGVAFAVASAAARGARLPEIGGGFPGYVWAAPMAAAVIAHRARGGMERALLAAGFAAGLVVVAMGR